MYTYVGIIVHHKYTYIYILELTSNCSYKVVPQFGTAMLSN